MKAKVWTGQTTERQETGEGGRGLHTPGRSHEHSKNRPVASESADDETTSVL